MAFDLKSARSQFSDDEITNELRLVANEFGIKEENFNNSLREFGIEALGQELDVLLSEKKTKEREKKPEEIVKNELPIDGISMAAPRLGVNEENPLTNTTNPLVKKIATPEEQRATLPDSMKDRFSFGEDTKPTPVARENLSIRDRAISDIESREGIKITKSVRGRVNNGQSDLIREQIKKLKERGEKEPVILSKEESDRARAEKIVEEKQPDLKGLRKLEAIDHQLLVMREENLRISAPKNNAERFGRSFRNSMTEIASLVPTAISIPFTLGSGLASKKLLELEDIDKKKNSGQTLSEEEADLYKRYSDSTRELKENLSNNKSVQEKLMRMSKNIKSGKVDDFGGGQIEDAMSYISGDGSLEKMVDNFNKSPDKFMSSGLIAIGEQLPVMLSSLTPASAIAIESARFQEDISSIEDKIGVKIDDDLQAKFALTYGAPSGLLSSITSKLTLLPGSNILKKQIDKASGKALTRAGIALGGRGMAALFEGLEEVSQSVIYDLVKMTALSKQKSRLMESKKFKEADLLDKEIRSTVNNLKDIDAKKKEGILGVLLGGVLGLPSTSIETINAYKEGKSTGEQQKFVIDAIMKIKEDADIESMVNNSESKVVEKGLKSNQEEKSDEEIKEDGSLFDLRQDPTREFLVNELNALTTFRDNVLNPIVEKRKLNEESLTPREKILINKFPKKVRKELDYSIEKLSEKAESVKFDETSQRVVTEAEDKFVEVIENGNPDEVIEFSGKLQNMLQEKTPPMEAKILNDMVDRLQKFTNGEISSEQALSVFKEEEMIEESLIEPDLESLTKEELKKEEVLVDHFDLNSLRNSESFSNLEPEKKAIAESILDNLSKVLGIKTKGNDLSALVNKPLGSRRVPDDLINSIKTEEEKFEKSLKEDNIPHSYKSREDYIQKKVNHINQIKRQLLSKGTKVLSDLKESGVDTEKFLEEANFDYYNDIAKKSDIIIKDESSKKVSNKILDKKDVLEKAKSEDADDFIDVETGLETTEKTRHSLFYDSSRKVYVEQKLDESGEVIENKIRKRIEIGDMNVDIEFDANDDFALTAKGTGSFTISPKEGVKSISLSSEQKTGFGFDKIDRIEALARSKVKSMSEDSDNKRELKTSESKKEEKEVVIEEPVLDDDAELRDNESIDPKSKESYDALNDAGFTPQERLNAQNNRTPGKTQKALSGYIKFNDNLVPANGSILRFFEQKLESEKLKSERMISRLKDLGLSKTGSGKLVGEVSASDSAYVLGVAESTRHNSQSLFDDIMSIVKTLEQDVARVKRQISRRVDYKISIGVKREPSLAKEIEPASMVTNSLRLKSSNEVKDLIEKRFLVEEVKNNLSENKSSWVVWDLSNDGVAVAMSDSKSSSESLKDRIVKKQMSSLKTYKEMSEAVFGEKDVYKSGEIYFHSLPNSFSKKDFSKQPESVPNRSRNNGLISFGNKNVNNHGLINRKLSAKERLEEGALEFSTPVQLDIKNPFDFRNKSHVKKYLEYAENNMNEFLFGENVETNEFIEVLESRIKEGEPELTRNLNLLQSIGFDGSYAYEDGQITLSPFSPSSIKPVVFKKHTELRAFKSGDLEAVEYGLVFNPHDETWMVMQYERGLGEGYPLDSFDDVDEARDYMDSLMEEELKLQEAYEKTLLDIGENLDEGSEEFKKFYKKSVVRDDYIPRETLGDEILDEKRPSGKLKRLLHGTAFSGFSEFLREKYDPDSWRGPGIYMTEGHMDGDTEVITDGYAKTTLRLSTRLFNSKEEAESFAESHDNYSIETIPTPEKLSKGAKVKGHMDIIPAPKSKVEFDKGLWSVSYYAKPSPGVYVLHANITNPFDIENEKISIEQIEEFASPRIQERVEKFADGYTHVDYAFLSDISSGISKKELTDLIKAMGYDGITHIGGVARDVQKKSYPHRVWIAFEPNQVKSAFNAKPSKGSNDLLKTMKLEEQLEMLAELLGEPNMLAKAKVKSGKIVFDKNLESYYNVQDIKSESVKKAEEEAEKAVNKMSKSESGLFNKITRVFKEKGWISLRGIKINSPEEMGAVAQIWRNPKFETVRYVFLDENNEVMYHEAVSSRRPSSTTAFDAKNSSENVKELVRMRFLAEKKGAKSFYMLHNHPDGDVRPSSEDLATTMIVSALFDNDILNNMNQRGKRAIADFLGGRKSVQKIIDEVLSKKQDIKFKGHIISNHKRFSVGTIESLTTLDPVKVVKYKKDLTENVNTMDLTNSRGFVQHQLGRERPKDPFLLSEEDLADYGPIQNLNSSLSIEDIGEIHASLGKENFVTLGFIDSNNDLKGLINIRLTDFKNTNQMRNRLNNLQVEFGSDDVNAWYFGKGDDIDLAKNLLKPLLIEGVITDGRIESRDVDGNINLDDIVDIDDILKNGGLEALYEKAGISLGQKKKKNKERKKERVVATKEEIIDVIVNHTPIVVDSKGKEAKPDTIKMKYGNPSEETPLTKEKSKARKTIELIRKEEDEFNNSAPKKDWINILGRAFIANEFSISRHLMKTKEGQAALEYFQLNRGAPQSTEMYIQQAERQLYEGLTIEEIKSFDELLMFNRALEVAEIGQNRLEEVKLTEKQKKELIEHGEGDEVFLPREIVNPGNLSKEEIESEIEAIKNNNPSLYETLEKRMDIWWELMSSQVDLSEENGLITSTFAKYLRENHKRYSPRIFIHHLDKNIGENKVDFGNTNSVSVRNSGFHSLDRGSDKSLIIDSKFLLRNVIGRTQARIFKNNANKALLKWAEKYPDNLSGIRLREEEDTNVEELGMQSIVAFDDGVKVEILIPKELAAGWQLYDPDATANWLNITGIMLGNSLLKAAATGLNPEFALANLPRDIAYTLLKQHRAYGPFLPVALGRIANDIRLVAKDVSGIGIPYYGKGLKKGIGPLTELYIKNGGGMETLTQQGFLFKKGLLDKPRKGFFGKKLDTAQKNWQTTQVALGALGQYSEMITRVALMRRVLDIQLEGKGDVIERLNKLKKLNPDKYEEVVRKSVWTARTNIDFAQGGSFTKGMDKIIPYLNASIQGTRGSLQSFGLEEALAGNKEEAAKRLRGASVIASQIILLAFMPMLYRLYSAKDDEEERERIFAPGTREKEQNWIIPLSKSMDFIDKEGFKRPTWLRISKDQGQRIFSTLGEQMAVYVAKQNGWHDEDVDAGQITMALTEWMVLSPDRLPAGIEAWISYFGNYDNWRKREIWAGLKVNPEDEVYGDEPKVYQAIGKTFGTSPVRMDVALNKIMPSNIWTTMIGSGVEALFSSLTEEEKSEVSLAWQEKISGTLDGTGKGMPGARKVFRTALPIRIKDVVNNIDLQKMLIKYGVPSGHTDSEGNFTPWTMGKIKRMLEKAEKDFNGKKIHSNILLQARLRNDWDSALANGIGEQITQKFQESSVKSVLDIFEEKIFSPKRAIEEKAKSEGRELNASELGELTFYYKEGERLQKRYDKIMKVWFQRNEMTSDEASGGVRSLTKEEKEFNRTQMRKTFDVLTKEFSKNFQDVLLSKFTNSNEEIDIHLNEALEEEKSDIDKYLDEE